MLIKAGERQRPGVEQSERVPRAQTDSLQAEAAGADELTLADRLGDPSAQNAFDQAELSDVLGVVMRLPEDQRTLILDRFWLDRSQEETAATLGISDRMVRYRLKAILRELGVRYHGDEEEGNRG
jgi:DNA-directed RNA polymerase specialized sigma24 family protein